MKGEILAFILTVAVPIALLSGCSTTTSRIREKQDVFARLSPVLQQAIQSGKVGLKYTPEMIYMALGQPNRIVASADGREVIWTYMNYNAPEGGFMPNDKNIISSDPLGVQKLILGIAPPSPNSPPRIGGLASEGTIDGSPDGNSWFTVTGKADMDRGALQIPDRTIRPKTATEMINDVERQDILIKFIDGKVVDFELVRI